MSGDTIETIELTVTVQANGIIRRADGYILGRCSYDGPTEENSFSRLKLIAQAEASLAEPVTPVDDRVVGEGSNPLARQEFGQVFYNAIDSDPAKRRLRTVFSFVQVAAGIDALFALRAAPHAQGSEGGCIWKQVSSVGNWHCQGCGYPGIIAGPHQTSGVKFCAGCGEEVVFHPFGYKAPPRPGKGEG